MTLGIDFGLRKAGTALLADGTTIAFPHKLIRFDNHKEILAELEAVVAERSVKRLVFGLPLSHDGEENEWCDDIRRFAYKLQKRVSLPLIFVNERLTSVEADRHLIGTKKKTKKESRDLIAAMLILDVYLTGSYVDKI